MKNVFFLNIIGSLLFLALCDAAFAQSSLKRTDLQQHDLSITNKEVIQARIDFLPDTFFGFHCHPGEEIIYVLEGIIEYQLEGQNPIILKAGEVLFVPAGIYHSAKNIGTTTASELATYVVEKGKPLISARK